LQEALRVMGAQSLADNLGEAVRRVTRMRWQTRLSTGYKPQDIKIPKRFKDVKNWKGKADPDKLGQLKQSYADYIMGMA
jgi:aldehyde:ferredoxin oxidoreductase